jgi:pyruvate dehydrogenase E1 component alpha subunit
VETLLDGEGRVREPSDAAGVDLRALYKALVHARCLDLRLAQLGVPMWVSGAGEEAAGVLVGRLLQPEDWVHPGGSRDVALALARGVSVAEIVRQATGQPDAETLGRSVPGTIASVTHGIAPATEALGMHVALAAGRAHGQRLAGRGVTVVSCGEGLTVTGAFHESVALAVSLELPLVIVCKSRPWPTGAPAEAGQLGDSLVDRLGACGLSSRRCDGADVLSTLRALSAALTRARRGDGPAFVEVFVTPLSRDVPAHRDPVERLRRCLDARGEWTQTFQDVVEAELRGRFDQVLARAGAAP